MMKKFTTVTTAISLLLVGATANAAKCKFETDTTNALTGEKVQWTKWEDFKLFNTQVGYLAAVAEGDNKYLAIQVVNYDSRPDRPTKEDLDTAVVIPAESKLLLLLTDESVVELRTDQEFVADSEIHAPGTWENDMTKDFMMKTYTVVKYPLSPDAVAALAANGVKTLRQTTSEGDRDYEISEKRADTLQEALACVQ
ncbi:MAG: hypothetical protein GTO71_09420 [Woeseiaceae bacterium]|nr:hypothetical protein [Woeseiaceae bacterium]NIP21305.1 hypothetical protein [Woeseiaceae bacterium]NIS90272.1 hypothetical protein [Woeseiaceae bacterium]